MTSPTPRSVAVAITYLAAAGLAQAAPASTNSGAEPWEIAAIVIPLAGFAGWLVRWILARTDARDAAIATRETAREKREEDRAEQAQMQTRAMQEAVVELRRLNEAQTALPDRIVEKLHSNEHLWRKPA